MNPPLENRRRYAVPQLIPSRTWAVLVLAQSLAIGAIWIIYETNTFGTLTGPGATSITGTTQGELKEIPVGQFSYYNVGSNTTEGNVLLSEVEAMTAVPEPSTWVIMILGFAGVGFISSKP